MSCTGAGPTPTRPRADPSDLDHSRHYDHLAGILRVDDQESDAASDRQPERELVVRYRARVGMWCAGSVSREAAYDRDEVAPVPGGNALGELEDPLLVDDLV